MHDNPVTYLYKVTNSASPPDPVLTAKHPEATIDLQGQRGDEEGQPLKVMAASRSSCRLS